MHNISVRHRRAHDTIGEPASLGYAESIVHRAVDAMFRRERRALVGYLARHVGGDCAGDMAQDVFLRAATSPQVTNLINPGGFLRKIAQNLLIDRARRERRALITVPLSEACNAGCAAEQTYELEASDVASCLERSLAELPERTRTIFVMSRFGEMPYREIHLELDISLSAVEYHMMKALDHIRASLSEEAPA